VLDLLLVVLAAAGLVYGAVQLGSAVERESEQAATRGLGGQEATAAPGAPTGSSTSTETDDRRRLMALTGVVVLLGSCVLATISVVNARRRRRRREHWQLRS
jgi:hypothetical protein